MISVAAWACLLTANSLAHAADWADSQEVRDRIDKLRTRSKSGHHMPYVESPIEMDVVEKPVPVRTWRSITYNSVMGRDSKYVAMPEVVHKTEVAEADKLGYQIDNEAMRDKILELYRRPGVVVEQYVIGQ